MGLASSLTTALTGMSAAETQVDVVGNNLANSQTVGFKESRSIFATQFLQTYSIGSGPSATNGGTNLVKPDIAAADGAVAKTPGFLPFFGTSAAAPHAAAIAALVKSARPDYTNAQILTAMLQTALDIRAPGLDRDSGHGIVMGLEAVTYALTH